MRRELWIAAALLLSLPSLADTTPVCNIRDFGAKGDGATLDTGPISAAIAACVKQGGGTVYVPPGRYVIGTVQLFSHIRLFLESGAALVGSQTFEDYLAQPSVRFRPQLWGRYHRRRDVLGMLIAKNAEDISIEGQGEIDGEGDSFMGMTTRMGQDYGDEPCPRSGEVPRRDGTVDYGPVEPAERPGTMIVFYARANVRLHGITLRRRRTGRCTCRTSSGAAISGIQILNDPRVPNNDGIDCMKCRNVRISDCDIRDRRRRVRDRR